MMQDPDRPVAPGHAHARTAFHHLLDANPNYFGNLPRSVHPPVTRVVRDTTYEEIRAVSVHPVRRTVQVTVEIKRPAGYRGPRLDPGSVEHVRVYADRGAGWEDLGCSRFRVFDDLGVGDFAGGRGGAMSYLVSVACEAGRLGDRGGTVRLRVILAWEVEPPAGTPDWLPVWGNVVEEQLWLAPRERRRGDLAATAGAAAESTPEGRTPPRQRLSGGTAAAALRESWLLDAIVPARVANAALFVSTWEWG